MKKERREIKVKREMLVLLSPLVKLRNNQMVTPKSLSQMVKLSSFQKERRETKVRGTVSQLLRQLLMGKTNLLNQITTKNQYGIFLALRIVLDGMAKSIFAVGQRWNPILITVTILDLFILKQLIKEEENYSIK